MAIVVEDHVLIPLADGVHLAAAVHRPDMTEPVPALLSVYPYHKDDLIASMLDHPRRYFVEHGYAHVLVDLRGTGGSEGTIPETTCFADEGRDHFDVIAWIADQPWCDGNVGMWGISYGGWTTFAAAATNPPALKAVVPIMAGTDSWTAGTYLGGRLNALNQSVWLAFMSAMDHLPPTHRDPAGNWRALWNRRLADPAHFLGHGQRVMEHDSWDDFWARSRTPVEDIRVPTMVIGGWRDEVTDASVDSFAAVDAPKKLVMGPWPHTLPNLAPATPVDNLLLMRCWFDKWLRGIDHEEVAPGPVSVYVIGADTWRHEPDWPPPGVVGRELRLTGEGGLDDTRPTTAAVVPYTADPTVGVHAPVLFGGDLTGVGLGGDQTADEQRSLVFESAPLAEPLELLGSVEATLRVTLEQGTQLPLVVKLNEATAAGPSRPVAYGWLDAELRDGLEQPRRPVAGGDTYDVTVRCRPTAHRVAAGSRLRLAVACADWPRILPPPDSPIIAVHVGGDSPSCVRLPTVALAPADTGLGVGPPSHSPEEVGASVVEGSGRSRIERDNASDAVTVTFETHSVVATPDLHRMAMDMATRAAVAPAEPGAARIDSDATFEIRRRGLVEAAGETVRVDVGTTLWRDDFVVVVEVRIDGRVVHQRRWNRHDAVAVDSPPSTATDE